MPGVAGFRLVTAVLLLASLFATGCTAPVRVWPFGAEEKMVPLPMGPVRDGNHEDF